MDLGGGNNNIDVIREALQYVVYILVGVFSYFGKKALNDVSELKDKKADKTYVDSEIQKQEAQRKELDQLILVELRYIRRKVDNMPINNIPPNEIKSN